MIIKPKIRGFICTSAHPAGCAAHVREQVAYAASHPVGAAAKRVLVIGASTGYGLACRVAAAFCGNADTIGVFLERKADKNRTATAGWYNSLEFERLAKSRGLIAESINGDAFSNEVKRKTIDTIRGKMPGGKVDLIIYSLAAPKRTSPEGGELWSSVIKPIGKPFAGKTVNPHTGEVSLVTVEPAVPGEISATVKVMGGDDWLAWMTAMYEAEVLEQKTISIAFSYIGPEITHAVYKNGTIGMAKEDIEKNAERITSLLAKLGGKAFVAVNKGLVTQASSAIPVVSLYISILYKLMKNEGTHEGCIEQMTRMWKDRLYCGDPPCSLENIPVDSAGRIRMDDWEMNPDLQRKVLEVWDKVTTENVYELTDLAGYREDFLRLFGFGIKGVDYDADVPPSLL